MLASFEVTLGLKHLGKQLFAAVGPLGNRF